VLEVVVQLLIIKPRQPVLVGAAIDLANPFDDLVLAWHDVRRPRKFVGQVPTAFASAARHQPSTRAGASPSLRAHGFGSGARDE